ncbi:MAG: RsbRD N-terminal domain-containing protein, partial [Bdellovibrionia bacterium]
MLLHLRLMDSRQPSLHACDNAADCLREHKSEILEQWEARARKELRAASGKKHYLLIDSLPQFLDELIESLERQSPQLIAMKDIAQSHATQRASISDYDLDQVQAEYTILRQVIFEVIEHFADVTSHERNIILDFIVQGRVAAADEYMRLAKTQIASSQEELSLALESAEMGSFTYDIPSKRVHWSDTMIRLHGLTPEEFTGKLEDFWPRLLPEDRESIQKILSESIQHHRD